MKYISKRKFIKQGTDVVLSAFLKADEKRNHGERVINGSLGVLLDENGKIKSSEQIKKSLSDNVSINLGYAKLLGSKEFKEASLRWYFKDNYSKLINNFNVPFCATLGGTGGLTAALNLFLDEGDTVLYPNLMWANYKHIAKNAMVNYDTYELFDDDNKYGFASIVSKIEEYSKKQERVLILINDPCQNPTGYSLSKEEYDILFTILDNVSKNKNVIVLFDIAYLDYEIFNESHMLFKKLMEKEYYFSNVIVSSFSKTFGIYGLRIGSIFSINKNNEFSNSFISSISAMVRGTYSCPIGPALDSIASALLNENKLIKCRKEVEESSLILKNRADLMLRLLKENGFKFYPYVNGFFVTIKINNANKIVQKLNEKNIYLVALDDNSIRIAISSMNDIDIIHLIDNLKEYL